MRLVQGSQLFCFPALTVVGLPDAAVQEARERVRAAIRNSGAEFPMRRVTVNLAPADLRKAGPAYDLPIAVALLKSSEQINAIPDSTVFLGELSLDGTVKHTNGILPMVVVALEEGFETVYVPADDAGEASLVDGINVIPVESLEQMISHLRGEIEMLPVTEATPVNRAYAVGRNGDNPPISDIDFVHIKGQEHAKRAAEIAVSGGHNLLMSGSPGSGKTLLAKAIPSIMPMLSRREALEVTKIYSVCGLLPQSSPLISERPFRSPHHTISNAGLVGGSRVPRPGEITLSHRGVLFLDELPEFNRTVLEVLRQPLEDKVVTISRAQGSMTFPANFMLISSMNPCNCGWYGDPVRNCTCSPSAVARYRSRISGPLLDRIDLFVDVPRVDYEKLVQSPSSETSAQIRHRVEVAHQIQQVRFDGTDLMNNADMGPSHVWEYCQADEASNALLQTAVNQMQLSARGFHRILKVARTIADLAQSDAIGIAHVAEALQYRSRDME